jgi:transposase
MKGIGIDVCKARLDVLAYGEQTVQTFDNDSQGHRALVAWLSQQGKIRVLLEATGGYEQAALEAMCAAGVWVCRLNPRQVRDFAKATGQLAKTDALDAHVLAHMVTVLGLSLKPYQPTASWRNELAALTKRRLQVHAMLLDSRRQLALINDTALLALAQPAQQALNKELKALEQRIQQKTQAHLPSALTSMKGIGPVMRSSALALLPELGYLKGKAISKLVGVAPLNCDSGKMTGTRHIWGGRAALRQALYMSTLSAIRYAPEIRTFYQRLKATGKPGKVVIVACMRKLLVILNARVRDEMQANRLPVTQMA